MDTPLVSVLMTAFNRERYIGAAIESVLASTFSDFELIITDDRSSDNTVSIAETYAQKDARVKVYINEQNLGDYPNRNKAASHARGKYLKYVDADDYIYPWGLQHLVEMMERFPEAGWGLCSLIQTMPDPYPFQLTPAQAYQRHYLGAGLFHKAPLSSIIKREVFEQVGGFKPIRMAGDYEMWHRLALSYPVVLMPDGMVWYREHEGQEMTEHHKYLATYEKISREYFLSEACPLTSEQKKYITINRRKQIVKSAVKAVLKLKWNELAEQIRLLNMR